MSVVSFPELSVDTVAKAIPDMIQLRTVLNTALPFHLMIDQGGGITHAGPSFQKLFPDEQIIGAQFFDLLKVRRPAGITDASGLRAIKGERLILSAPTLDCAKLKAVAIPLGQGALLIDLSLGAGVLDIVSRCNLKNKDFSPADPTVDMIYMMEVQSFVYQQHKTQSQKLQGAKVQAEEKAYTDALTGLANRRALESHMKRLLRRSRGKGFALMQIDLDHFKAVNDTQGHAAGDRVLHETACRLRRQMRASDLVARVGGDEFVIIMSDYGTAETVRVVAERLIDDLRQPFQFGDVACRIGASVGATIVSAGSKRSPEEILATADRALYTSKDKGRGVFHLM
ncbi:GGDEF domain-containing protein [Neptunicoccus cionae]|uniref:guanylate cyclase n=1 Tax=Neptunicoccus cionae TaxID=2035344 RepID=A0A916QT27_9RHOB|nr:GGDEF domain-containing protein [Amylibacter cionae]GGA08752.1 GGDEF domain-containing protein [Amylibacter cionae]